MDQGNYEDYSATSKSESAPPQGSKTPSISVGDLIKTSRTLTIYLAVTLLVVLAVPALMWLKAEPYYNNEYSVGDSPKDFLADTDILGISFYGNDTRDPLSDELEAKYRLGDITLKGQNINVIHVCFYDEDIKFTGELPKLVSDSGSFNYFTRTAFAGLAPSPTSQRDISEQNVSGMGGSSWLPDKTVEGGWNTSYGILSGAIRSGLLEADTYKNKKVSMNITPTIPTWQEELGKADATNFCMQLRDAVNDTVEEVTPHLKNISEIYIAINGFMRIGDDSFNATGIYKYYQSGIFYDVKGAIIEDVSPSYFKSLKLFLSTPVPVPDSDTIRSSMEITPETKTEDIFNPACFTSFSSTYLGAAAFVVVALIAIAAYLLRRPGDRVTSLQSTIISGLFTGIALVVTLKYMNSMSHWVSGQDMSDPQVFGMISIILSGGFAGAVSGTLSAYIHKRYEYEHEIDTSGVRRVVPKESEHSLKSDCPIKDKSQDRLNFSAMVDSLREFLDNKSTEPPIVISLNGPWGSGKSSIMQMLNTELCNTGRFESVWFNAWQFRDKDSLLAAFLKAIADQFKKRWGLSASLNLCIVRFRGELKKNLREFTIFMVLVLGAYISLKFNPFNTWLDIIPVVLPLGHAAARAKKLFPFDLNFKKLFSEKNYGERIGFFEDFKKEFSLYRDAVPHKKFVIFIDDLDRCPADEVVEVLKNINLVCTGGDGAVRTFFVLGFDSRYIEKCVEVYFERYIGSTNKGKGRFGREYIKKMVTLQLSVPKPVAKDFERLGGDAGEEGKDAGQTGSAKKESFFDKLRSRLLAGVPSRKLLLPAGVFACLALAGLFAVIPDNRDTSWNKPAAAPTGQTVAQVPSGTAPRTGNNRYSGSRTVDANAIVVPRSTDDGWDGRLILSLIAISGAVILRKAAKGKTYPPPQTRDSEAFVKAKQLSYSLFPENPRDAIRMFNRMRAIYLIQKNGAYEGTVLSEEDCVYLTLLQYNFSDTLNLGSLKRATAKGSTFDINCPLWNVPEATEEVRACIRKLLKDKPKLKRFLDVNYHVLLEGIEQASNGDGSGSKPAPQTAQ